MWPSSDPFRRKAVAYVLISLLCALFAAVYEMFSHGVWSYSMVFAFAFPLAGGALPVLLLRDPSPAAAALWRAGLAAWTVGSIFRGALEIYGTTHALTLVYPAAGALLCAAALATQIGSQINKP